MRVLGGALLVVAIGAGIVAIVIGAHLFRAALRNYWVPRALADRDGLHREVEPVRVERNLIRALLVALIAMLAALVLALLAIGAAD